MSEGQKTPVRVCKHSTKKGIFVLIGGERRWRAFHKIMESTGNIPTVNAFIDAVHDERHHYREALVDNLHREDLDPLDEAAAMHRLHEEDKMSIAEIAKLIGKSVTYVDGRVKIHTLPDIVKKLMDPGVPKEERLSVTIAVDIARSTNNQILRTELAREVSIRSLGVMDSRQLITSRTGTRDYESSRPGRKRRASDDHLIFRASIGGFLKQLRVNIGNFDIASLYDNKSEEERERRHDYNTLKSIIDEIEKILPLVSETSEQRMKRKGVK